MADISKIQVLNGDIYDVKDAAALHGADLETTTVGSASAGESITVVNGSTHTTLGSTALTNTSGSTTDFKLSLSNVLVNLTHSTTSVPNISVTNQTVVTGITAS